MSLNEVTRVYNGEQLLYSVVAVDLHRHVVYVSLAC